MKSIKKILEEWRISRIQQMKMLQSYVGEAKDWLWDAVTYAREMQDDEISLGNGVSMPLEEAELFLVRLMIAERANSLFSAKWNLRKIPKYLILRESTFRRLREAWKETSWIG